MVLVQRRPVREQCPDLVVAIRGPGPEVEVQAVLAGRRVRDLDEEDPVADGS
jgi:hypothetical protein